MSRFDWLAAAPTPHMLSEEGLATATALCDFTTHAVNDWAHEGRLLSEGLYAERRDATGAVVRNVPRRAMVQARQIFVICDSARRRGRRDVSDATETWERLIELYAGGDLRRGLAFSVDPMGRIVSDRRDAYAHAFALLAASALLRATGDANYGRDALALDGFIQNQLIDPHYGGLFMSVDGREAKAQNPLMHLLEAYLFLHEAAPDGPFLERAAALIDLFEHRMLEGDADMLAEFYANDWAPHPESRMRYFEPGHHFEWIWLLAKYDGLAGADHSDIAHRLWRSATRFGLNLDGTCLDAVGLDGRAIATSHRLWPHTEGVKAAIALHGREENSTDILEKMLSALTRRFLGWPFATGWQDRFDCDWRPVAEDVPASSLYHLYLAERVLSDHLANGPQPASKTNARWEDARL